MLKEQETLLPINPKKKITSQKPRNTVISLIISLCVIGIIGTVSISGPSVKQDTHLTAETPLLRDDRQDELEFAINISSNALVNPIVQVGKLGAIEGVNLISRDGRNYFGFYNVPYAQPPLGQLRFQHPQPVQPWAGTKDCTVKGTMCVQKSRYNPNVDVEGTEDCLHVNVFTPFIPSRYAISKNPIRMPVIVYFFGGNFMHGTANDFNCDYFMDEDVVMVIVESRVGALGYLSTGDMEARGNMGLKDQVMALKWVQQNIESFNGDSTRVVAFGTSSGAMSAHAHLLSPMTKGLFSGVMSFSGTMLTFNLSEQRNLAFQFGDIMNCTHSNNSTLLLDCLRNVTAEDIALNQPDFHPTIETIPDDKDASEVFLPDSPINLILKGQSNDVPWITGVNSAEAILDSYLMLLDTNFTEDFNKNWREVIPQLLRFPSENKTLVDEITEKIYKFYFDGKALSKDSMLRFNFTDMLSDRVYYHTARTSGLNHAKINNVFWYYLTREANVSFADAVTKYFDPPYGVSHADEVQYFFSRPRYPYIPHGSKDEPFSDLLVKLWVSFAKNGIPINPDWKGAQWPPVDPKGDGMTFFNLDETPKLIEPFTERMKLWDSFPIEFLYT